VLQCLPSKSINRKPQTQSVTTTTYLPLHITLAITVNYFKSRDFSTVYGPPVPIIFLFNSQATPAKYVHCSEKASE